MAFREANTRTRSSYPREGKKGLGGESVEDNTNTLILAIG